MSLGLRLPVVETTGYKHRYDPWISRVSRRKEANCRFLSTTRPRRNAAVEAKRRVFARNDRHGAWCYLCNEIGVRGAGVAGASETRPYCVGVVGRRREVEWEVEWALDVEASESVGSGYSSETR